MTHLYTQLHKEKIENTYKTIPWYGNRDPYYFQLRDDRATLLEDLVKELNPTTVLDYGSGNGLAIDKLEKIFPNIQFTKYDPFVLKYSAKPQGSFELVVAHRVMRSVETEFREQVIADMYNYASKNLLIELLIYDIDVGAYEIYDAILSKYNVVKKGIGAPVFRQGSDGDDHNVVNAGYLIQK